MSMWSRARAANVQVTTSKTSRFTCGAGGSSSVGSTFTYVCNGLGRSAELKRGMAVGTKAWWTRGAVRPGCCVVVHRRNVLWRTRRLRRPAMLCLHGAGCVGVHVFEEEGKCSVCEAEELPNSPVALDADEGKNHSLTFGGHVELAPLCPRLASCRSLIVKTQRRMPIVHPTQNTETVPSPIGKHWMKTSRRGVAPVKRLRHHPSSCRSHPSPPAAALHQLMIGKNHHTGTDLDQCKYCHKVRRTTAQARGTADIDM